MLLFNAKLIILYWKHKEQLNHETVIQFCFSIIIIKFT